MALDEDLQKMHDFVLKKLDESGEYSSIEPEWRPGADIRDPHGDLDKHPERQILAVQDPKFQLNDYDGRYLIILHTSKMDGPEFGNKLMAASSNGIRTINILYKDAKGEHDFFRRRYRPEDRKKGTPPDPVKYRRQVPWKDKGFEDLSMVQRNRLRVPIAMEKDWIPALTGEGVIYYQPESKRLNEMLRQFKWGNVKRAKWDMFLKKSYDDSLRWYDPVSINDFNEFTLVPTTNWVYEKYGILNDPTQDLISALSGINKKDADYVAHELHNLNINALLAGKMLPVPKIDANSIEEMRLRRGVGMISDIIRHHPSKRTTIEGLKNRLENLFTQYGMDQSHPLVEAYESALDLWLYEGLDPRLSIVYQSSEKALEFPRQMTLEAPSKSMDGVTHLIHVDMPSADSTEWKIVCGETCPAHKYRVSHWHPNKVTEYLTAAIGKASKA